MLEEDSPLIFWNYCAERSALITDMTINCLFQLGDTNVMLRDTLLSVHKYS